MSIETIPLTTIVTINYYLFMGRTEYIFILGMLLGSALGLLFAFIFDKILGEKTFFRINHHFSITKGLGIFSIPIWGIVAVVVLQHDIRPAILFFYSGSVGTILEFSLGFSLHRFLGIKLWHYEYGSLGKYTSIFSFPYWGGAGLIFVALGRIIGA